MSTPRSYPYPSVLLDNSSNSNSPRSLSYRSRYSLLLLILCLFFYYRSIENSSSSSSSHSSPFRTLATGSNSNNGHHVTKSTLPQRESEINRYQLPKLPSSFSAATDTLSSSTTTIDIPVLQFYNRILDDTVLFPQHMYGIFLFTVVIIDQQQNEEEQALYLSLTQNWIISVTATFSLPFISPPSPSGSMSPPTEKNYFVPVIIAIDQYTCERINNLNLPAQCIVDSVTSLSYPFVNRIDPVAGTNIVLYKYVWTHYALNRGFRVLYSDIDIVFPSSSSCHPLQYLLTDKLLYSSHHNLPDIQLISDHSSVTNPHECSQPYQCTIAYLLSLKYTTRDWSGSTYDKLYPYDNLMCFLINNDHYPSSSSCVSTAFWLAESSTATIAFFNDILLSLASMNEWEQRLLNRLLPHYLDTNTLMVHILDPLIMGNIDNRQCGQYVHSILWNAVPPPANDGDSSSSLTSILQDMCRAYTTDTESKYHHTYPSEWVSLISDNYRTGYGNSKVASSFLSSESSVASAYDPQYNFTWNLYSECSTETMVQQPLLLHAGYYKGIDNKIKALQDNGGWFII